MEVMCFFFFFQAEDGIRDGHVTGVQTCALPILGRARPALVVLRRARRRADLDRGERAEDRSGAPRRARAPGERGRAAALLRLRRAARGRPRSQHAEPAHDRALRGVVWVQDVIDYVGPDTRVLLARAQGQLADAN